MPGTSGRMCEKSTERTVCALSSAITSWKRAKRSYGTPPPCWKHSTMSSSTVERRRDPLRLDREIVGRRRAREPGGVLRGKRVARRLRIELDDAPRRHRAEPLAHVALVQPGRVGELVARRAVELRRARRTDPSGGRRRSSPRARRRSACRACARRTPRRARVVRRLRPSTPPVGSGDSSLPRPCSPARAAARRTPTARSSATRAARRSPSPGEPARSAGSSRSSSSTSSASPSRAEKLDPEDVRAFLDAVLRAASARELESFGGTVEKFVGDAVMGVFGAPTAYGDDAGARRARRVRRPRLGRAGRARRCAIAVNTGEAIVALDAQPGARRGDGRRRRREHRRPSPVRRAGRRGARRRGDVREHARLDRVPPRPAGPREGQGGARPRVARASGDRRDRRAPGGAGPDDRARPRARRAHRHLGARRRRGARSLRHGLRPGRDRQVANRARARAARRRSGRHVSIRGRSTPYGASTPVQRVRAAGEADRRRSSTATTPRRRERSSRPRSPRSPARRRRRSTRRISRCSSASATTSDVADREQLFFSARVLVESLALRRPDAAPVRGHPLGRREPARPARDARGSRPRRPGALRRARAARAPRRAARLGRRAPGVHGAPARAAHRELRAASSPSELLAESTARETSAPQPSPRRPRATRSSSRSSPRRIAETVDGGATSCRRASARSSRPGSTRSRPTSAACSSTRRSSDGSSGAARSRRSQHATTSSALLGSLEARDLIQREAVSASGATSSSRSSTG